MALVDAYDTRTGENLQHRVPAHFIGHPVLGEHLSKTTRQKAADAAQEPAGDPDESWTIPQLRSFAGRTGVDLTGATTKPAILAAITTPAAGDSRED